MSIAYWKSENCTYLGRGTTYYLYGDNCKVVANSRPPTPTGGSNTNTSSDASPTDALNVLVDSEYVSSTLTAVFIMFAIGLGVGQAIKFLGKLK